MKSVKLTNITTNYYDSAKYNRLVKAADGIEDHDAVVMEQLKNASGVGSKIKVYQTDEKGNIKFDKNNNPIEDTSDSDAVKTKREAAQKASEDAWGKAIGTGSITDPTESETNDPEKNGSQQLVTGGTVYKALHGGLDDIVIGHDGKDGQPGKDGSIGLVGPKGKDGKDGFTTTVIKTEKGVDGVDGKNGEDGITRIVYNDTTDPDKKHTVATLDDGMKYAGDTGDAANVKLDHQLKLSGTTFNKTDKQYKEEDWTSDNIAVVSNAVDKDGNAVMNLKLAKDLKGLNSSTFTTTETTGEGNQQKTTTYETLINDKGLTITSKSTENGTTTPTNGPSITIDGINAGNKAITNIGSVVKDGKYTDGQKNYAATLGDVSAIARNTVKVVPGTHTSVTKGTDADNATTYAVNVITGTVNQNDQGLVTGDEVFKAIENLKISGGSDIKVDLNKLATTDAKNVGKNYSSGKTTDEEKTADVIANENAWGEALGTGEVTDPNGSDKTTNRSQQLVTGGTVYTAIHDTLNGGLEKIIVGHEGTNGQNGKEGSIGLNGKNGKDGKDGITTTIIKTEKGQLGEKGETGAPGVDGTDITRIVYENKKNDDGKHTVATLDDGMKYAGDVSETGATDAVANVKLDHQLKLSGTTFNDTKKYNAADWTSDNIAVVSSAVDSYGNAVMNLKLAKDLKDLNSSEYTTTEGDKTYTTIINGKGLTIQSTEKGSTTSTSGPSITIDGIDAGGKTITNVGSILNGGKYDANTQKGYAATLGDVDSMVKDAVGNASGITNGNLDKKANIDASNIGSNIKVYETDESGKIKLDENNNPIENTDATTKAQNDNKNAWASAIGTDTVAKGNNQLVTSGAVATALEGKADKTYVNTQVGNITNGFESKLNGKANKDLDNITEAGRNVIRDIAKAASKITVVAGTNTTVTPGTDEKGGTTYEVNVEGKGKVAADDTGLISGDTLYKEVHVDKNGTYIKSKDSATGKDMTVAQNLSALDTGLKTTSDLIHTSTDGSAIQIGSNSTATKVDISGQDAKGNKTGRVITGVVSDASDPNSAANVGYVNGITEANNEQIYRDMNMQYNHVENDISRAAAGSNALAALHPMQEFDPDDKAQFAVGYGHYRNSNAGAVGAFYQPDENSMVNFGVSFGNGDAGINAGVTFKFGPGGSGHHALTKTQMAKVIDAQSKEIDELKKDNADKDKRIDALEQKMTEILAKLDKSKD